MRHEQRAPRGATGTAVLVASAIAFCGCNSTKTEEPPPPAYDDSLLEVVWEEQAKSRAALKNYTAQYRVVTESDANYDGVHNTGSEDTRVVAYRQGNLRRYETSISRDQNIRYAKDERVHLGPQQSQHTYRFVTNDRVSAVRRQGTGIDDQLRIWFHTDESKMASGGRSLMGEAIGLDLIAYTFSIRNGFHPSGEQDERAHHERLLDLGGVFHARRMHDESGEWIEVTYHRDGRIWSTARIEPDQGYATTRIDYDTGELHRGRRQQSQREVKVRQLSNGVWVPLRITGSKMSRIPGRETSGTIRVDVEGFSLNQPLDRDQFNFRALGYRGTEVYIYPEGDKHIRVSFLGKYLEPMRQFGESERARADRYIRKLSY